VGPGGGIKIDSSVSEVVFRAVGKELASTVAASVGVRHSLTAVIVMSAMTSSTSGSSDGLLVLLGPAIGESGIARASVMKRRSITDDATSTIGGKDQTFGVFRVRTSFLR
jgi:hypothetical protein